MNFLSYFFRKKNDAINYFELPSKVQKQIMKRTAESASKKKRDLLKQYEQLNK